jgi:GNAT superfamily N-acetyltransferase
VTGVRLRPAAAADLAAIARIWREGWADGHHGHVPEALVAERTPASFDERTLERISSTWVADIGGTVAGFVVVVNDEVEQVYVDRSWRGQGVAERLLQHAEAVIGQGRPPYRLAGRGHRQHPSPTLLRQAGLARPGPLHVPGADGDRHVPGPRPPLRARGRQPMSIRPAARWQLESS